MLASLCATLMRDRRFRITEECFTDASPDEAGPPSMLNEQDTGPVKPPYLLNVRSTMVPCCSCPHRYSSPHSTHVLEQQPGRRCVDRAHDTSCSNNLCHDALLQVLYHGTIANAIHLPVSKVISVAHGRSRCGAWHVAVIAARTPMHD